MSSRKVSPESLKNLNREGRSPQHQEKKTTHNISVTPTGWLGVKEVAKQNGCASVSELVERIGRQQIDLGENESTGGLDEQLQEIKRLLGSSDDEAQKGISEQLADLKKLLLYCIELIPLKIQEAQIKARIAELNQGKGLSPLDAGNLLEPEARGNNTARPCNP